MLSAVRPPSPRVIGSWPEEHRRVTIYGKTGCWSAKFTEHHGILSPVSAVHPAAVLALRGERATEVTARDITRRQRRYEARAWTRGRRGARRVPLVSVVDGFVSCVKVSMRAERYTYEIRVVPVQEPQWTWNAASLLYAPMVLDRWAEIVGL